jgi:hypothetical protein
MISISEAKKTGRLKDFVVQEESRGIGPISGVELDLVVAKISKAPQPQDQTSGSHVRGGSSGKKTPSRT